MAKRKLVVLFLLILGTLSESGAQVLDDTTKNIYGPETTRYIHFEDLKLNREQYFHPDTTIQLFHIYSFVNRNQNKLQDLGNIGTAAKPVFYRPPGRIGRSSGYYAYYPYLLKTEEMKLFNTRSPFTNLYVIFGGGNRNITLVEHAQNIRPNWGFGGNFKKLTMNKQVSSTGRGDNQVESTSYNFNMYYWTVDSSYMVWGAFNRMNHETNESGGIDASDFIGLNDYFDENLDVNLEEAASRELNIRLHLYQQYNLKDLFTLYNETKRSQVSNYFIEDNLTGEQNYFNQILFNTEKTFHRDKFRITSNESGIKGDLKNAFYNAYFRYRNFHYSPANLQNNEIRNETYIGGRLRYDNDTTFTLLVTGELMNNGNHKIRGLYENRLWELSYQRLMYAPGAIHETYFSNHYEWHNDFGPVQSDNFKALFKIDLDWLKVYPQATLSNLYNYIYFDYDKKPVQADAFVQLYSPGLSFNMDITPYLKWRSMCMYSLKTGEEEAANAFRFPSLFANSNISYTRFLFNNKLWVSAGIDMHYRNSYFADSYDPVTQQFYIQDDFEIPGYFLADVYLNAKISTVKIFLKMTYVNQGQNDGYFATPFYIGQPQVLDLGVSWMFYD